MSPGDPVWCAHARDIPAIYLDRRGTRVQVEVLTPTGSVVRWVGLRSIRPRPLAPRVSQGVTPT